MKYIQQELELYYIVPALRREFAIEMKKRGIKAVEIAKHLGLTKAAVSQYFSKMRAKEFAFDKESKKEIKESVDSIIKGKNSFSEIQRVVQVLRNNSSICKFHKKKEHVKGGCDICFQYAK